MMADEENKAIKLTFSESVEVPGQVLSAGTYWFTLADSESDRNIVQMWNADRTRLVATVLAIPDYGCSPRENHNPFRGETLRFAGSHSFLVLPR